MNRIIFITAIVTFLFTSCKVFKEGQTTIEQAHKKVNSEADAKFELIYTVKDKQNRDYFVYRQFKKGTSVVAVAGQNLKYESTIYRIFDYNRIYYKGTRSEDELKLIVEEIKNKN